MFLKTSSRPGGGDGNHRWRMGRNPSANTDDHFLVDDQSLAREKLYGKITVSIGTWTMVTMGHGFHSHDRYGMIWGYGYG